MNSQVYETIEINGLKYVVNKVTGELIEAINIILPIGSKVYTPAQQEAYKAYRDREDKKAYRKKTLTELGYFYFVARENQLERLTAESAARLIYLCTYLDYNNNFMLSQRQHMKKADLQSVLGLSTGTTYKLWHEINPLYVIEDVDGLKLANTDIIHGKITSKQNSYQRLYIEAIRRLYRSIASSKHRYLGRIYQMLPFINMEFNILCWNPYETILDDVKPIKITDFCELIGYNKHDYKKLLNMYSQIIFDVNGEQEYFLSYVINNNNLDKAKLFVNPHILYCGSDYKRVEILGAFTKV